MSITTATVKNIHVGPGTLVLSRVENGSTVTVTFAATEDGGVLRMNRSVEYVEAAEVVGPLFAYITSEEVTFELQSLELDANIISEAYGFGGVTTVAATTGVPGYDAWAFGGACGLEESSLQYIIPRECKTGALTITIDLYRVVATPDIEQRYTRSGKTVYRVAFRALADMSKSLGERIGKITVQTSEGL